MTIALPTLENLERAAHYLRSGELVAFPTETVYGLGADARSDRGVQKIFSAKGRPSNNPLIVHIHAFDAIESVADLSKDILARRRVEKLQSLWPGPLSVVLPKAASISSIVCGGHSTSVAVRIPKHSVALELLSTCKCPIAAPSANISGYISPTSAAHVESSLGQYVSLILDGGSCAFGVESTVVSLLGEAPMLLRPGAIGRDTLSRLLGEEVLTVVGTSDPAGELLSPGLLLKHYAPKTRTVFAKDLDSAPSATSKVAALWFSADPVPYHCEKIISLSKSRDPNEIAPRLYASLRELDQQGWDLILLDECSNADGLGEAVMDRLVRATRQ